MSPHNTSKAMQFIKETSRMLFMNPFSLLPLIIFFLFFLHKRLQNAPKTTGKNSPSSPSSLPVIGHLHLLGKYPHRSLQKLSQKHGDLMLLRLGNRPTIIVSSAEAAEEIMKTHDTIFSDRPHLTLFKKLFYNCIDIVFSPYGPYWRQTRSICTLQLLSNKRVQSFRGIREEETASMIENIRAVKVVNLSEMFISLTFDIICRVAFGRKYQGERGIDFSLLLDEFVEVLGSLKVGDYIPWLSWIDHVNGLNAKADKIAKTCDEFLEMVIEEHLDAATDTKEENKDLVDVLLEIERNSDQGAISRDCTKAIILDMFSAGTDTAFITLEWTMSEILKHPRVMEKLQKEVRGVMGHKKEVTEDHLENLEYLKVVIKESFRLHPPLPLLVPRESTQDAKIQGYDIAANTQILTNVWAIGRDPRYWEEPEKFYPERFLTSPIDYRGHHFQLLPFGAGRRGCPGISFAIGSVELVLANLMHQFDWELPNGLSPETLDMAESLGIATHKKVPLCAIATPRFTL